MKTLDPKTATYGALTDIVKGYIHSIGLKFVQRSGTEGDQLGVFTILSESTFQDTAKLEYVFCVFVWKLNESESKHIEYVFLRDGRVQVRDHHAKKPVTDTFLNWKLGIDAVMHEAAITLDYISSLSSTAANMARDLGRGLSQPSAFDSTSRPSRPVT
ncbi:MAG: hypothetical protein WC477_01650 [Patescibacteria group bacterium]